MIFHSYGYPISQGRWRHKFHRQFLTLAHFPAKKKSNRATPISTGAKSRIPLSLRRITLASNQVECSAIIFAAPAIRRIETAAGAAQKVSLLYEVQAGITHSRQRLTHRQLAVHPQPAKHQPHYAVGDVGLHSRHRSTDLVLRLRRADSGGAGGDRRAGRRRRDPQAAQAAGAQPAGGQLRPADRTAARHQPAAAGPVVDDRHRHLLRHRHRQTAVRRPWAEPVQPGDGRLRGAADLLPGADDQLVAAG